MRLFRNLNIIIIFLEANTTLPSSSTAIILFTKERKKLHQKVNLNMYRKKKAQALGTRTQTNAHGRQNKDGSMDGYQGMHAKKGYYTP